MLVSTVLGPIDPRPRHRSSGSTATSTAPVSGNIEDAAGLTVYEPDNGVVHFARWIPFGQNAVSRSAVQPPAREEDGAGRVVALEHVVRSMRSGEGIDMQAGTLPGA